MVRSLMAKRSRTHDLAPYCPVVTLIAADLLGRGKHLLIALLVGSAALLAAEANAAPIWITPTNGIVESSPDVANGTVYVGSNDGNVYALDAITGHVDWTAPTGGAVASSPSVVNGLVYVGSNDGSVYALDATTGKEIVQTMTGGPVISSPSVVNGVVYVGSNDGGLYALDANTGKILSDTVTGAGVMSSPDVVNGVVFFGSNDHSVWAVSEVQIAVPLPATLPLFTTGLGALGLLGWRRKRKAAIGV